LQATLGTIAMALAFLNLAVPTEIESQFTNPRFSIKSTGATWVLKFQSQFIIQKQNKNFECVASCNNSMHYATIKPLTSKIIRQKNKQTKDWKLTSTLCCLLLFNYKAPMATTNCWGPWEQEVTPYWDKSKLEQQEGNNNVQKAQEQTRACDKAMVTCE
jgi:hypothetical protein